MERDEIIEQEGVERIKTAEIGEIIDQARAARTLRGLPRPEGLPPGGWYSRQRRKLKSGEIGVYLMYRWHGEPGSARGNAKSLGRLN